MRLLIITSQFPIAGEPNRGRPILQTVRALSQLAEVRVLSPVATYPRWATPRSYLFRDGRDDFTVEGCDAQWLHYPALPLLTRPFNGHLCGRSLHAPLRAFAPDVVLAYWLYPDAYGAMRAARRAVDLAMPHLKPGSAIINTSSVTAYRGNPTLLDYSSTKGAITSFTRSLALSLAEKQIRVNAIVPGPIWTPLIPSTFSEEQVASFGTDTPLGRVGQPAEVAPAFVYLASNDASYVCGQVIHVNGGSVVNG